MRALTPDSQRIAISCFQDGVSAEATTQAVNCLRGADQYAIDDIRGFQRADPLFLSQQILHLESQRHGIENATGGIDDQIKALKNALYQALTQKISTLQRQSSSLTNMDGSISRQIQALEQQLNALVAQHAQPAPMAPAPSSSPAIQSTRDSQHDNPPLHAPSTSRLGPQSFPTSLRSFQSLDTGRGQSSNHRIETQVAPNEMPIASNGLGQPPTRIKPTDAQIQAYALNADGTIRTFRAIRAALHENGFFATTDRITEQTTILQSKGFGKRKTHATDDQIRIYSRNADGSKRTTREIASALRNANFSVANDRIVLMTKPQPRDANNNAMDD
jgi:chaperonin cofactor prefoldin